jgi:hypothetical protein
MVLLIIQAIYMARILSILSIAILGKLLIVVLSQEVAIVQAM